MEINPEIEKKVKEKLEKEKREEEYLNNCCRARICPECGIVLKVTPVEKMWRSEYACLSCGFVRLW